MKKREGRVILLLGGALGNVSHTHTCKELVEQ